MSSVGTDGHVFVLWFDAESTGTSRSPTTTQFQDSWHHFLLRTETHAEPNSVCKALPERTVVLSLFDRVAKSGGFRTRADFVADFSYPGGFRKERMSFCSCEKKRVNLKRNEYIQTQFTVYEFDGKTLRFHNVSGFFSEFPGETKRVPV